MNIVEALLCLVIFFSLLTAINVLLVAMAYIALDRLAYM
jgi:hypothetical protein